MRTRTTIFVILAVTLTACGGKSAADYQAEAQAALNARDTAKAVSVAEAGLADAKVRQDAAAAWRLEQIRIDALAREGKGAQVKAELERLAGTYPKQVNGSLYRAMADRAKTASDTGGAIEILTAGDQRFPAEHASFAEAIEALKNAGNLDPAQVEKLKSLGYL
jgi:hypothetical protein